MSASDAHVGTLVGETLRQALADEHMRRTGAVPRDIAAVAVRVALADTAGKLRAAAAGRREYAAGAPSDNDRAVLDLQASTLDHAADVVDGDLGPMFSWLPSWRWTDEMDADLAKRSAAR